MSEIWQEPVRGGYADVRFLGLDGAERMRVASKGTMPAPPIHHLTGLRPVEGDVGAAVYEMPASPWWQTSAGVFTPGVMAFLADAPLGAAVSTMLPAGKVLTTSDITMNFLRPASVESGRLVGQARAIQVGETLGLAEVTVADGVGRVLAHGTTRCFLFQPFETLPEPPKEFEPYVAPEYDTPDPYLREDVPGEVLPQDVWDRMTGLEILRGLMDGSLPLPPFSYFTGGRWTEAEEGTASFALPMTEWMNSPALRIYGGTIAMLTDICLVGAVQTTVPARTAFSPLDVKVHFVRPVAADGRDVIARGTVVHRGRKLAVANAELVNADGKVVAIATGSSLILPDRPWTVERPVVAEEEAEGDEEQSAP